MAWIEPPVRVTVDAVVEGVPLHVVVATPDTSTPLGKLSVRGAVNVATAGTTDWAALTQTSW